MHGPQPNAVASTIAVIVYVAFLAAAGTTMYKIDDWMSIQPKYPEISYATPEPAN